MQSVIAQHEEKKPQIKILGKNEIEIIADSDIVIFPIQVALSPEAEKAKEVRLKLVYVSFQKIIDQRFFDAISVAETLDEEKRIIITSMLNKLPIRQGTYDLIIEVEYDSLSEKGDTIIYREHLSLKFIYPEATLEPIPMRKVEIVVCQSDSKDSISNTLFLKETSGQSRLTGIKLIGKEFFDAAGKPVDVKLEFDTDAKVNLDPYDFSNATFNLYGRLPMGVTTGTAEISAPQLKTPISLEFQIRKRRAYIAMYISIIIGAIIGWFIRYGLKYLTNLNNARESAQELIEKMEKLKEKHTDTDYFRDIDKKSNQLEAVLSRWGILEPNKKVKEITEEIENVTQYLNGQLKELNKSREDELKRINSLLALSKTYKWLPLGFTRILSDVFSITEKALEEIKENKINTARDLINKLIDQKLIQDLNKEFSTWKPKIKRMQDKEIKEGIKMLPVSASAFADKQIELLITDLGKIKDITSEPTTAIAESQRLVQSINGFRLKIFEFFWVLRMKVFWESNYTIKILRQHPPLPDPDAVTNFEVKIEEYLIDMNPKEAPENSIKSLEKLQVEDVIQMWKEAITKQDSGPNVVELIKERKFAEAANAAIENIGMKISMKEIDIIVNTQLNRLNIERPLSLSKVIEPFIQLYTLPELERAIGYSPLGTSTVKWILPLLQTVIIALVFCLAGYLFYSAKFTGTWRELISIFFWAFTLDYTAESLIKLAKSFKKV